MINQEKSQFSFLFLATKYLLFIGLFALAGCAIWAGAYKIQRFRYDFDRARYTHTQSIANATITLEPFIVQPFTFKNANKILDVTIPEELIVDVNVSGAGYFQGLRKTVLFGAGRYAYFRIGIVNTTKETLQLSGWAIRLVTPRNEQLEAMGFDEVTAVLMEQPEPDNLYAPRFYDESQYFLTSKMQSLSKLNIIGSKGSISPGAHIKGSLIFRLADRLDQGTYKLTFLELASGRSTEFAFEIFEFEDTIRIIAWYGLEELLQSRRIY